MSQDFERKSREGTARSAAEFLKQIKRSLSEASIPYNEDASVGGYKPDLVIPKLDGTSVAVTASSSGPSFDLERVEGLAHKYSVATGADVRFIVDSLKPEAKPHTPDALVEEMTRGVSQEGLRRWLLDASATRRSAPPKTLFVAMPFEDKYDDTFLTIVTVARVIGAAARRIDQLGVMGDPVQEIKAEIERSHLLVADLSEVRPNVLYELGYADAIGKRTVLITSSELRDLPFDVRARQVLRYTIGSSKTLSGPLESALTDALRSS